MLDFIRDFVDRFGGRLAGSEEEEKAQAYLEEKLAPITNQVRRHRFSDHLTAKFGSLKIYCFLFYVSLGLYWVHWGAALTVAAVNFALFNADFLRFHSLLAFLFPKNESSTVVATLEPEGEVRSTIAVSGHMDSVREFVWWYYLGNLGMALSVISGLLFVATPLFYLALLIWPMVLGTAPGWSIYGWYVLVGLAPATLSYFFIHGSTVVAGAQDNLSGVAVSYAVFQHFAKEGEIGKSRLKHTRLQCISFGSEETGLKGSINYVRDHLDRLREDVFHLVNVDGIRQVKEIQIIRKERSPMLPHDGKMVGAMEKAFDEADISYRTTVLPVGMTDAAPFSYRSIPAMSIVALSTDNLDPTYHTRRDVPENVEEEALELVKKGVVQFIENWDGKVDSE